MGIKVKDEPIIRTELTFDESKDLFRGATSDASGSWKTTITSLFNWIKNKLGFGNQTDIPKVDWATTAALSGTWTFGDLGGVGDTLTRTTNGALAVTDGVTPADGDDVLIKDEGGGSSPRNGWWLLTQRGSAGTPTIFARSTSSDTNAEITDQLLGVTFGTANGGKLFSQDTTDPFPGGNIVYTNQPGGAFVTQAGSGTQAVDQIATYTGVLRRLTRGFANFKYNNTTNVFTIRGVGYRFPTANSEGVLTNSGSGTLTWEESTRFVKVSLTAAEIQNLATTPKTLIAAPAAGKVIQVISIIGRLNLVGSIYTAAPELYIGTGVVTASQNQAYSVILLSTAAGTPIAFHLDGDLISAFQNGDLLAQASANDATGDSTVDLYITYRIITL